MTSNKETVEEAAEYYLKMQYVMGVDESTKPYIINDFIAGANYQAKRMFTVEDLEKAFEAGEAFRLGTHELFKQTHPNFQEWVKQYKTQ